MIMKCNWIDKCVRCIFAFSVGSIIVILLTMGKTEYICKTVFSRTNVSIFAWNIVIFLGVLAFFYIFKDKIKMLISSKNVDCDKLVRALTAFLFLVELYISYNIHFKTGWDVSVIWENANEIAFRESERLNNYYYSLSPNNLFITIICAAVMKLNSGIGVFHGNHENMALIFINCMFISFTCYLVYRVLSCFTRKSLAFVGYIVTCLLAGLSPWMTIFYSDTLGILFPILIVYLYMLPVDSKVKKILKYALIIILSSIGYYIKPQVVIVVIAIFIIELFHSFSKNSYRQLCLILMIAIVWSVSILGAGKCLDKVYELVGFEIDEEAAYGPTHFFMMGLNEERNGVWAQEDVEISANCKTAKERRDVNIQVSIQRLKEFGILGYARHLSRKLLCTFNDGSFAWMHEGGFFFEIYDEPNTRAARFLRSFCYLDGKNLQVFLTFEQTIWLFVLTMCFGAALLYKNAMRYKEVSVIMLSVIGITLFEALFEVRARYLFIYVPFFCILAVMGIDAIWNKINILADKIRENQLVNLNK